MVGRFAFHVKQRPGQSGEVRGQRAKRQIGSPFWGIVGASPAVIGKLGSIFDQAGLLRDDPGYFPWNYDQID
jgi:hypothetical protein